MNNLPRLMSSAKWLLSTEKRKVVWIYFPIYLSANKSRIDKAYLADFTYIDWRLLLGRALKSQLNRLIKHLTKECQIRFEISSFQDWISLCSIARSRRKCLLIVIYLPFVWEKSRIEWNASKSIVSVFLFRSLSVHRRRKDKSGVGGEGVRDAGGNTHKNPFNRISFFSLIRAYCCWLVFYTFSEMLKWGWAEWSLPYHDNRHSRMCKENENVLCYVSLIEWKKITDAALDSTLHSRSSILCQLFSFFSFYFVCFSPFTSQFHSLHFT